MHIAIIDDEQIEADQLRSYFSQFCRERNYSLNISFFKCGENFLQEYKPIYDIVMMDIGLPGLNGMEIAQKFREIDEKTILIFVTNLAQFAVQGYDVSAMDFIVKPVTYPNFAIKIQRAITRLALYKNTYLTVTIGNQVHKLCTKNIQYIEISGHKIIYHTTDGTIEGYGILKDVEKNLNQKLFFRCNHCYLVNLAYVKAIRGYIAVVAEDELQISRSKKKSFLQALNNYHGGEL